MGAVTQNPIIAIRNQSTPLIVYLADGLAVAGCFGDPNAGAGTLGAIGSFLIDVIAGTWYQKTTAYAVATGWVASGSPSINGPLTGGTPGDVLFVGAGPTLAQDAGITYDSATDILTLLGAYRLGNAGAIGAVADRVGLFGIDEAAADAQLYAISETGKFGRLSDRKRVVTNVFNVANSAAPLAVPNLAFNLRASGVYTVRASLTFTAGAGSVRGRIGGSGGLTATAYGVRGYLLSANLVAGQAQNSTLGSGDVTAAALTAGILVMEATIVVGVAGVIECQFGQNSSNAANSSVLVGSEFEIEVAS